MTDPNLVSAGELNTGSTSSSPSFGQETAEGNHLVAFVMCNSSGDNETAPNISTSAEGWHKRIQWGGQYNYAAIFYKADCGADETAPTFSADAYSSYTAALLSEFSDVSTTVSEFSPQDQIGHHYGFPSACTADSGDSAASDLIVSLSCWNGTNAVTGLYAQITGSQGSNLTTNVLSSNNTSTAPQHVIAWAVNDSSLGSNANGLSAGFSSGYDNLPVNLLASFLAA